jgi:hypothetical protein
MQPYLPNMNNIPPRIKNQKDEVPLSHYLGIYKTLDPQEIARRCALPFAETASAFSLRFMGTDYLVRFPDFEMKDSVGAVIHSPYEKILMLRYLCKGKYVDARGQQCAYQDIPWGNVYYQNFRGRCILRLAYSFGNDVASFKRIMEETNGLRAEPLKQGDAGYRFEFMTGLYMSFLIWAGDDEFPPSAQILFDDNFAFAFTAEDIAVVGEVSISRLKGLRTLMQSKH